MREDAYAQMRERDNPRVDYVVFPTKNGEVIRPDAEEARRNGIIPRDGPSGEINYVRGINWTDPQWAQVQQHLWRAYAVLKLFYGNPFHPDTLDVQVDLDTGAPNCYYDPGANVIVMDMWYTGYQTYLTHEMVHSFHDDWVIEWDHFEEGFATAVMVAVQNYLHGDEPIAEEMWHHYAPGGLEYAEFYYEYQFNQNRPGLATRLNDFNPYPNFLGVYMPFFRYRAAGFAWWKVFLDERDFFVDFNAGYYDRFCDLDSFDYCFHDLQEIAIQSFPGAGLEGIPFDRWLYEQPILNLPSENQTVMFLTFRAGKFQLWLYERKVSGGDDYEWPLADELVGFELAVPGCPINNWGDYTNDYGYICGDVGLSIPDGNDYRVRLSAHEPKRGLSRTALDFYNSAYSGGNLEETEFFGVTTGLLTGSVHVYSLDTGEFWEAPLSNGGFHFEKFPETQAREAGDGKYWVWLENDQGQMVKWLILNKDAAEYFVPIDDLDEEGASASAEAPAGAADKTVFAVAQNVPNPCSSVTTIGITLGGSGYVEVAVYDLSGRRVLVPFAGLLREGYNPVDINVASLAPGVYVYRVNAVGRVATKKMVVTH
jgi:hypothetical protein